MKIKNVIEFIFWDFLNSEITRIEDKLITEQNKNVRFTAKKTKFKEVKYNERKMKLENPKDIFINSIYNRQNINILNNKSNINTIVTKNIGVDNIVNFTINEKWIQQKGLNCRYGCFITLYYFLFSEYIDNFKNNNHKELKLLNELILKYVNNVNEENYKNIIKYLQDNNIDSNNKLIDKCVKETNPILTNLHLSQ